MSPCRHQDKEQIEKCNLALSKNPATIPNRILHLIGVAVVSAATLMISQNAAATAAVCAMQGFKTLPLGESYWEGLVHKIQSSGSQKPQAERRQIRPFRLAQAPEKNLLERTAADPFELPLMSVLDPHAEDELKYYKDAGLKGGQCKLYSSGRGIILNVSAQYQGIDQAGTKSSFSVGSQDRFEFPDAVLPLKEGWQGSTRAGEQWSYRNGRLIFTMSSQDGKGQWSARHMEMTTTPDLKSIQSVQSEHYEDLPRETRGDFKGYKPKYQNICGAFTS